MAAKKAARRSTRRSRSKPARRTRKSPARRAAARPKTRHTRAKATRRAKPARAAKAAAKTRRAKRPARKPAASATRRAVARRPAAAKPARRPASPPAPKPATAATATKDRRPRPAAKPALDRARRILPEAERTEREADDRLIASARSGGDELRHELREHTETSPTLTAGDVDADWQDAYAVGDEAPGGDNPTPDQDRVDEIGKALGVNYDASEELQGSEKIVERDRHRWELDPASSDDWPHDREKD